MSNAFNPYAAPTADLSPVAQEWLTTMPPSLERVAKGLGLVYIGLILIILTGIIGGIFVGVVAGNAPDTAVALGFLIVGIVIVGRILTIAGPIMCLATPEETGARGLIIGSVVCMLIGVAVDLFDLVGDVNQGIQTGKSLITLVGGILFILFLKKLAEFIGAYDLAGRAKNVLIVGIILAVILVAIMVMAFVSVDQALQGNARGGGMMGLAALGLAMLVMGLVLLVMYLSLLRDLKKRILAGFGRA